MTQQSTALITGASSGIGAAYAHKLAARGHPLVLVARDRSRLEGIADSLSSEFGLAVEVVAADLSDRVERKVVCERIAGDPAVRILVNNAGISLTGSWLDASEDAIERLLAVNALAPTILAQAAARAFRERGGGAIINIGSVLSLAPETFDGAYAATKAYLLALSAALGARGAVDDLYVQLVLPGATRTEIFLRSGKDIASLPEGWVMEAGDLVDAAMVGFDRRETVTIPPLHDEALWERFRSAREAMTPALHNNQPAPRYTEEGR